MKQECVFPKCHHVAAKRGLCGRHYQHEQRRGRILRYETLAQVLRSRKTKRCCRCGRVKPLEQFHANRTHGKIYRQGKCKACMVMYLRQWRQANPEKWKNGRRAYNLQREYGLTVDEYNARLAAQHGVCAICSRSCSIAKYLSVDHDHSSGKIRGLLCRHCNSAIGYVRENRDVLRRMIDYLDGTN